MSLGVIWYRTRAQGEPRGNFYYLDDADRYRGCDPDLFDKLKKIRDVGSSARKLETINDRKIIGGDTEFFSERVPDIGREAWFAAAIDKIGNQDIIFMDPDKGLQINKSDGLTPDRASIGELRQIVQDAKKIAVVYHHHEGSPMRYRSRDVADMLEDELRLKLSPEAVLFGPGRNDFYIVVPEDTADFITNQDTIYRRVENLMQSPKSEWTEWSKKGYLSARLGDQTCREAVETGLTLLSDGLSEYCSSIQPALMQVYGEDWISGAIEILRKPQKSVSHEPSPADYMYDPFFLLDMLRDNRLTHRRIVISRDDKKELGSYRNSWAHFREITKKGASDCLRIVAKVLKSVGDDPRRMRIEHQHRLLRRRPAELTY